MIEPPHMSSSMSFKSEQKDKMQLEFRTNNLNREGKTGQSLVLLDSVTNYKKPSNNLVISKDKLFAKIASAKSQKIRAFYSTKTPLHFIISNFCPICSLVSGEHNLSSF